MENKRQRAQGSAITELALVLPLLVLFILSLFDGLIMAREYITMTEIAREGVLAAGGLGQLPLSTTISQTPLSRNDIAFCFDSTFENYQPAPHNKALCAERTIQWRLLKLGIAYRKPIDVSGLKITVSRDVLRRTVMLEIERDLRGVSPFFKFARIKSRAEGPYDL